MSSSFLFDVVTIGAATRDVFLRSEQFERRKDSHAPDGFDACFPMGAKIDIDDVIFETGGGATNAAVTFQRLGCKTACVARIGRDIDGAEIIERLKKEKISANYLQRDPKQNTGYSVILLAGSGHRSILVHRGASNILDPHIPWQKLRPRWVYLTSVAGNKKLLTNLFREQKKRDLHVAWNPGNAELEMGLKQLTPWLSQCDIVILNRTEAAILTDESPRHLESIMHRLSILPRQALVITDGEHGAYVAARGTKWHAPALRAKRINTTGAGDAFGSAFTATAIKTGNLDQSLRVALLNATGVITHMGAKAGILKAFPSKKELERVKVDTI